MDDVEDMAGDMIDDVMDDDEDDVDEDVATEDEENKKNKKKNKKNKKAGFWDVGSFEVCESQSQLSFINPYHVSIMYVYPYVCNTDVFVFVLSIVLLYSI